MKKQLYFMRHGETEFNIRRKKQGWCDSPLTEAGRQQALRAGEYFKKHGITFTHAYASTSERACDTLELVSDHAYERVKGLKEWNFGLFEGESEDMNPPVPYGDFYAPFGGERELAFRERIYQTVKELMERNDHTSVLMVSHGAAGVQFLMACGCMEKAQIKGRLANCGILIFTYEDGVFTFEDYIDPNNES